MKQLIADKKTEFAFLAVLLCIASFLLLWNIDNQYLWQDEAETANISRTILTYGIPMGYDGKNFFSQVGSSGYNENYVWILDPWLPFFLVAFFFKMFGVNTFAARLPFVLFGIAVVLLTYFFSKSLLKSRRVASIAAFLLTVSVPFLILSRQCRYYSLVIFFSLLGLYGYIKYIEGKRKSGITFLISSIFLFHSNYVFCAILLVTVFVHSLLCHRHKFRNIVFLCLAVTVINAPWILCFAGLPIFNLQVGNSHNYSLIYIGKYFLFIVKYIFPPVLIVILLISWGVDRRKSKSLPLKRHNKIKPLILLLLFIVFTVVTFSLLSSVIALRYLGPLIPIFCILMAVIIEYSMKLHVSISVGILAFLIITSPFVDFLYEITHDYDGPIEGIVKYLNKNAKDDDTVLITYGDAPLKFYTDLRVIGGRTDEDLTPAYEADWIILRKYWFFSRLSDLVQHVPIADYEKIVINYPDTQWENRESLEWHHFRTVENEDRVILYHKIR